MDEYMFRQCVNECQVVHEATSYVEIFNYSDSFYNSVEEHALSDDEFDNFLHRRGAFAPPDKMREETKLLSGIRLIVQKNAKQKDTFKPKFISLSHESYEAMVRTLRLPLRGIETTAVVGPFFWCAYDDGDDEKSSHLQIIHRKSDVRKKGMTRGWEVMLSHCFKTSITTGYVKGTPSADMERMLRGVRACAAQVGHPLLLPAIILSYDLSPANDEKQREARDWTRRLENAVSLRDEVEESEQYFRDGLLEVDGLGRDLVECHGHVMWKRPQAYFALVKQMELAMERFETVWRRFESGSLIDEERAHRKEIERLHKSLLSRMEFYKAKLTGLENYIHTTLARIKVQREKLYNIMSQGEAKLNLEMAIEQRRIAHASKRDGTAMKTISLMGTLFLPGTYLASVFSMTFFNFQSGADPSISKSLWVYFAITIPITAIIVGAWFWYEQRREARHAEDDRELEEGIEDLQKEIMNKLRKRPMTKASTWTTLGPTR